MIPHALPNLYLAAPLFSEAELTFNARLRAALLPAFSVYLPQQDGILLADAVRAGQHPRMAARAVFEADIAAISKCDVLLAVLDGRAIDEGVAFEIGFAYAIGKPCFGFQTDPRRLQPAGNNPMVEGALRAIFPDLAGLLEWAKSDRPMERTAPTA